MSVAVAIGLGISLKPTVFTNDLWVISDTAPTGIKMLQQSVCLSPSLQPHWGWKL